MTLLIVITAPLFAQCDWNSDGQLDIMDVVGTVDCILTAGCWGSNIYGCIDPAASNYDQTATIDDCSCEYDDFVVCGDTFTDYDGNVYETVQIGNQCWMAENLKVTHYNDGTPIPTGYSVNDWVNLSTGAYAVYPANNDAASIATCGGDCASVYGNLYNWHAVDTGNLAPAGWHVPTDEEWMELEMALGMSESEAQDAGYRGTDQGSQLAGNADLWNSGNLENDPEFGASGFDALPGGYRSYYLGGYYYGVGFDAYFWSSTESNNASAWNRRLHYGYSEVDRSYSNKKNGFAARLVRD